MLGLRVLYSLMTYPSTCMRVHVYSICARIYICFVSGIAHMHYVQMLSYSIVLRFDWVFQVPAANPN